MAEPVTATLSCLKVTLQAVVVVKGLYDANSQIPAVLGELEAISITISRTIATMEGRNDSLRAALAMIDRELVQATKLLSQLKAKSKKFFFNPTGTLKDLSTCSKKLKEGLDLAVLANRLNTGLKINSNLILKDLNAKRFWSARIGENQLSVPYATFCNALALETGMTPTRKATLARGGPAEVDIHKFNNLTQKNTLSGVINLLDHCNPFLEPTATATEKAPKDPNSTNLPLHDTVSKLRHIDWSGASLDKADPVNKYFYIMSEAGGVLDVWENSNRPGAVLFVTPPTGIPSQKWKFDKYGCIVNLNSGLVIDLDKTAQPGNAFRLIQWPRHGGQNQMWRLGLDRSLRSAAKPNMCIDVDTRTGCIIMWTWRGNPNQMWRIATEIIVVSVRF